MENSARIEKVIKNLQDAAGNREAKLSENIIAYDEYRKASKGASLYQFGIISTQESSRAIAENVTNPTIREDAIFKIAKEHIVEIFPLEKTHKKRKEKIESALRLLIDLYKSRGEKLQPRTLVLIARAYLLRSLIIRPKGIMIPEKKRECLKKGITFIKNVLSASITLYPSEKEEAYRVQCLLLIELNRIDEKQCSETTLKGELEKAITNGCNKFDKNEEDVRIAIRYSEIKPIVETYLREIVKSSSKGTYLEKAKAFYLLGDICNLKKCLYKVIRNLRWMKFSHPQWDAMVCFLKKMRGDKNMLWKEFSVKVWQACQIQERGTPPINLHWHWSRQRDLYDLAFLAVYSKVNPTKRDYESMAKICDSLKSRTSLRWSSIDDMVKEIPNEDSTKEDLRKFLKSEKEAYELAMMGGYVKDMMDISERMKELHAQYRETFKKQQSQQRGIAEVPGWVVIHFYLNQLEGKGYALIYGAANLKWIIRDFSYERLFKTFLTWQTNYNLSKEKAASSLVDLCKEIGRTMPFLFDEEIILKGRDVLFIPHDFLHRLPLHGAIQEKDNAVFLENHPCCYLPAWSFAAKKNDTAVQGRILLKNFPEYPYKELVSDSTIWTPPLLRDPASPDDLKTIDTPPELLVILCHGKADVVNPFNARLKLTGNGISHLEILQAAKMKLRGSKVILGACETDLVPPLSDVMDEHLSITTAFLTKGVKEVLGTMWEALVTNISDLNLKIIKQPTKDSMRMPLWDWQKKGVRDYRDGDIEAFYLTLVFRVTGLCI